MWEPLLKFLAAACVCGLTKRSRLFNQERIEIGLVAVRARLKKFGVTSESHERALKAPRAI
jgi:hypothetical protein